MKKAFDMVKNEVLIRGVLYLPELAPGFEYRKKLAQIDTKEYCVKLQGISEEIKKELKLTDEDIFVDCEKPRILLSVRNAKLHLKYLLGKGLLVARVEEAQDLDLELEVEFLR